MKNEDNVISLVDHRKLKHLRESVIELKEINKIIKPTINSLTKYNNYSSIKDVANRLYNIYDDIRRAIEQKEHFIERFKR